MPSIIQAVVQKYLQFPKKECSFQCASWQKLVSTLTGLLSGHSDRHNVMQRPREALLRNEHLGGKFSCHEISFP